MQEAVVEYAHCEYSNGFIVFNRMLQGKEIWRLASDYDYGNGPNYCPEAAPDEEMYTNYRAAKKRCGVSHKGHFKPWALINAPSSTNSFRFVFPTLLGASSDRVHVWDVRTGKRTMSCSLAIASTGMNAVDELLPGRVNYVEVSDKYIFTCCTRALRVYHRDDFSEAEEARLAMHVPSSRWSYGKKRYKVDVTEEDWGHKDSQLVPHRVIPREGPEEFETWSNSTRLLDFFVAGKE